MSQKTWHGLLAVELEAVVVVDAGLPALDVVPDAGEHAAVLPHVADEHVADHHGAHLDIPNIIIIII